MHSHKMPANRARDHVCIEKLRGGVGELVGACAGRNKSTESGYARADRHSGRGERERGD